jgi:hypothetical protein
MLMPETPTIPTVGSDFRRSDNVSTMAGVLSDVTTRTRDADTSPCGARHSASERRVEHRKTLMGTVTRQFF